MAGGRQGGQGRIDEQGRIDDITDAARDFAPQGTLHCSCLEHCFLFCFPTRFKAYIFTFLKILVLFAWPIDQLPSRQQERRVPFLHASFAQIVRDCWADKVFLHLLPLASWSFKVHRWSGVAHSRSGFFATQAWKSRWTN